MNEMGNMKHNAIISTIIVFLFIACVFIVILYAFYVGPTRAKLSRLDANTIEQIGILFDSVKRYRMTFKIYPTSEPALIAYLTSEDSGYLDRNHGKGLPRDAWGTSIIYDISDNIPYLKSAGPDRLFGTSDDIVVYWPASNSNESERYGVLRISR